MSSQSQDESLNADSHLKSIGHFAQVAEYSTNIVEASNSFPSESDTLHEWRIWKQHPCQRKWSLLSPTYTDDDQIHVKLGQSKSIGGENSDLPGISEITVTLPEFSQDKKRANLSRKYTKSPIDLSDYSAISQNRTTDECLITAYSRVDYPRSEFGKGRFHEGTFEVFSGKAKLEGPHRSFFSWYSAIAESLRDDINTKGFPTVAKETKFKVPKPEGAKFKLGVFNSSCDVNLTLYDKIGREHCKNVTMTMSGFFNYDCRPPVSLLTEATSREISRSDEKEDRPSFDQG